MTESFQRSPRGLKNLNEFFNCDIILVVETDSNANSATSFEERYWLLLAKYFHPERKFHVQKRGNCDNAVAYARALCDAGNPRYICCIDKDFKDIFGTAPDGINVILTFGYSFENDLICRSTFEQAVVAICGGDEAQISSEQDWDDLTRTLSKFRSACIADQICCAQGHGFIPRASKGSKAFLKIVKNKEYGQLPEPDLGSARQLLLETRTRCTPQQSFKWETNVLRHLYGKLAQWLFQRFIILSAQRNGRSEKISDAILGAFVLIGFREALHSNTYRLADYYRDRFSAAVNAAM